MCRFTHKLTKFVVFYTKVQKKRGFFTSLDKKRGDSTGFCQLSPAATIFSFIYSPSLSLNSLTSALNS